MKKIIPVLSMVLIFGCGKRHVTEPVNPVLTHPYKLATATGGTTGSYNYTAKYSGNLLTALVSSHDSIAIAYNASGRPISKITYTPGYSFPTRKAEFDYDGSGHIIADRMYSGTGGTYFLYQTAVFHYTGNKPYEMVVLGSAGDQSFRFAYTWTGGDVTLIKTYDYLNNENCSDTISYDLSHTNNIAVDFPDYRFLDPTYDPGNYEELLSEHPWTRMSLSCVAWQYNPVYTYDAAGRITKIENGPTASGYMFSYTQ